MSNFRMRISSILFVLLCAVLGQVEAWADGPLLIGDETAVSIYRDFDDGLFGRSRYRGVVFSAKLSSFERYRSLSVGETDGLTAYLLSDERAQELAQNRAFGTSRAAPVSEELSALSDNDPRKWRYSYDRRGIRVIFSLERAPEELYEEIRRTYPNNPSVSRQVTESYRDSWIIRIHEAENVYRPFVAQIDYEDVMIAASMIGNQFQPLWGLHDGNDICAGEF